MNEEHVKFVQELVKENIKKYGEICKNERCGMHEAFCRCKKDVMKKRVKAPAGYHWMKRGNGYRLMKHKGQFVPHKGASLFAPFEVVTKHKKNA